MVRIETPCDLSVGTRDRVVHEILKTRPGSLCVGKYPLFALCEAVDVTVKTTDFVSEVWIPVLDVKEASEVMNVLEAKEGFDVLHVFDAHVDCALRKNITDVVADLPKNTKKVKIIERATVFAEIANRDESSFSKRMSDEGWQKKSKRTIEFEVRVFFFEKTFEEKDILAEMPWNIERMVCEYNIEHASPIRTVEVNIDLLADVFSRKFRFANVELDEKSFESAAHLEKMGFNFEKFSRVDTIDDPMAAWAETKVKLELLERIFEEWTRLFERLQKFFSTLTDQGMRIQMTSQYTDIAPVLIQKREALVRRKIELEARLFQEGSVRNVI